MERDFSSLVERNRLLAAAARQTASEQSANSARRNKLYGMRLKLLTEYGRERFHAETGLSHWDDQYWGELAARMREFAKFLENNGWIDEFRSFEPWNEEGLFAKHLVLRSLEGSLDEVTAGLRGMMENEFTESGGRFNAWLRSDLWDAMTDPAWISAPNKRLDLPRVAPETPSIRPLQQKKVRRGGRPNDGLIVALTEFYDGLEGEKPAQLEICRQFIAANPNRGSLRELRSDLGTANAALLCQTLRKKLQNKLAKRKRANA